MTTLDIQSDEVESGPAKRGYTRRGARTEAAREPARDPARSGAVVEGRDGEVLSRRRTSVGDPFDIPKHLIPKGWTYQWNTVSVYGNKEVALDSVNMMWENAWRPVPAERHPGEFAPHGTKGEILRGGVRLEERPLALTLEARAEEERSARQIISDRNESLKLAGVTKGTAFAARPGQINMNIGRGVYADEAGNVVEAPRPAHQLAERDE